MTKKKVNNPSDYLKPLANAAPILLRLPLSLKRDAGERAKRRGVTLTGFIRASIEYYLDALKKE